MDLATSPVAFQCDWDQARSRSVAAYGYAVLDCRFAVPWTFPCSMPWPCTRGVALTDLQGAVLKLANSPRSGLTVITSNRVSGICEPVSSLNFEAPQETPFSLRETPRTSSPESTLSPHRET